jgi:hypothetical protein
VPCARTHAADLSVKERISPSPVEAFDNLQRFGNLQAVPDTS